VKDARPGNADIHTTSRRKTPAHTGVRQLRADDPELAGLLDAELEAQTGSLALVARASLAQPSALAAAASVLSNPADGAGTAPTHPRQSRTVARAALARRRNRG
jgi:glycine hydroxymethyltransferase